MDSLATVLRGEIANLGDVKNLINKVTFSLGTLADEDDIRASKELELATASNSDYAAALITKWLAEVGVADIVTCEQITELSERLNASHFA